jgi:translation initiation factor IF-2
LGSGIGTVTEADVKTAAAKGAVIFGFRVDVDSTARGTAERQNIRIASYDIIYELIEAVRNSLAELLPADINRTVLARMKVLALFKKEGKNQILGGKVTSGAARRGALVDLVQGKEVVRVGKLTQLQHNKEDVETVREGSEAGLRIDISGFTGDIQVGDVLEICEEERVKATLS